VEVGSSSADTGVIAAQQIGQNCPKLSIILPATSLWCDRLLANRELVDAYLKEGEAEFKQLQQSCREKNPLLYQKLKTAQLHGS